MPVTNTPFAADGIAVNPDGSITVPMLLNQPRRILRDVVSVAAANYFLDLILPNGGQTSGGAVVFDIAQPADEFLDRDVQEVGELSEFPLVNGEEPIPAIKKVGKSGGKLLVSDEKRDRNDIRYVNREQTRLGNTMADKVERVGMATIDEAIVDYNRTTPVSLAWGSVVPNGNSQTAYGQWPHADLARARAAARADRAGVTDLNLLVVNPVDYVKLDIIYAGSPERIFGGSGGRIFQTLNRPAGRPLLAAEGQAGGTYWEKAIGIETWREPEIEGTFIQIGGRFVHIVDNPYALLELTGV